MQIRTYVGTKQVVAMPMTRQQYNNYRGWSLPEDELHQGADAGYLVEYMDGGKPNHPAHEGYISWSPKDVFDKSYNRTDGLTFGLAVELLKLGHRVARAGWNGKGMYLQYVEPYALHPDQLGKPEDCLPGTMNALFKCADNNKFAPGTMLPWIGMKTADNKFVPWLASQTDILATDWVLIHESA